MLSVLHVVDMFITTFFLPSCLIWLSLLLWIKVWFLSALW
jgi:hypothetical protein